MSSTPSNQQGLTALPFRSNANFFQRSSAIRLSLIGHVAIAVAGLSFVFFPEFRSREVEIQVIEAPKAPAKTMSVSRTPPKEIPKKAPKAVFGLSRKSITSETGETVKAGNTIAKEIDDTKLKPSDADSLPIPVDEYLVSRMPVLMSEIRIPYPPEAKKNKISGAVVMDILIDEIGNVRDAKFINGPSPDLNAAALTAVMGFKFKPAIVQDKAVAVRIRYAYRFILEN